MNLYTKEELEEALQTVTTIIMHSEKIIPKFAEKTSQHTLLKNRIKALLISRSLLLGGEAVNIYEKEELVEALKPIASVISKCEKARLKFVEGTIQYVRIQKIITAMSISKALIEDEISTRNDYN